jgi:hypothetical protein
MGKTVKRSRKLYKKMNKVKLKTKRKIRKNSVKKGGSWLSCSSKEGGNVKKPKPKPKPKPEPEPETKSSNFSHWN